jgi:DNA-binding NtrC family response regulator
MSGGSLREMIGDSAPMQRLRALVETAAPTRLSVLVEGPTGAGKELVAAALHELSGRPGSFVAFNVAAISDSMFEDALFGHVRGAFTGAVSDNAGFLREANGGTAFFDELSGLPASMQVKLLRAIETGRFRPVGARSDHASDFRVVAATNEMTEQLLELRQLRRDLMHRVAAVRIHVPSLDQRLEDLPLLVRHFLNEGGYRALPVTAAAIRMLQARAWPGNVRELKHLVLWSAAFAAGVLDERALAHVAECVGPGAESAMNTESADEGVGQERLRIREALERHSWDTESAARGLGVNRATLYRWMRKFQLNRPRVRVVERPLAPQPQAMAG